MSAKQKILITGMTGSGGSYLAEYILNHIPNIEIHGTTRDHSSVNFKNIKDIESKVILHYVDLTDFISVHRLFDSLRPDIIFHIASMANVRSSFDHPMIVINNNVNVTLVLLESVRFLKNKDGYNPIIQICSTSEVYGKVDPKYLPISEECPLKPINPYAVSKMTQDNLGYVYYLNYGLNIIRTRMFSYLNPKRGDLFATAFAKQILDIKHGRKQFLEHGNLDSVRAFIDVREAAESYWIATQKCKVGDVYNIGGGTPIQICDFLQKLIDKMGVPVKTKQNTALLRPSDISVQICDMSKFTKETGWKPTIDLDEMMDYFIKEIYKIWGDK